jgi:NADPH2:quinone reductase
MASVKAIRIHKGGGPEEMKWEDVEVGSPGAGQALVRHTAVGLNYIDTYFRTGLYQAPLPLVLGNEAAGVVEAVGPGVSDVKAGDRVGYVASPGAYCEKRVVPADRLVVMPAAIDDKTAAAMMLKGMTAQYLLRRTFPARRGDTVLIHAAAGGVGLIMCQWANWLGCNVIGTVGSADKAKLARAHGAHHVVNYREQDFVAEVKRITGGRGVPVVYDGVGKDTFERSLDCLAPLGMMVTFGNASGPVGPLNLLMLSQKGSLFVTRPTLNSYTASRADLLATANDLIDVVSRGAVKIEIHQTYALKDAAQAHRDLEARRTTGSTVLIP